VDSQRLTELRGVIEPFERARPLPRWAYVEADVFEREKTNVFATHPIPIAHVADLKRPGEWVRAPISGEHVILVRGADLEIVGLHALCKHRGTLLCEGERGRFERLEIACPYHGFTYATDGRLLRAPSPPLGVIRDNVSLDRIEVSTSPVGVVFATIAPLSERRGVAMPPWVERIKLGSLVRARTSEHEVRANWKTIVGNFQESHHFPLVHPSLEARTPWKRSTSVTHGDWWLGGEMELVENVETVSESGKLSGRALISDAEDARHILDALVFPLFLMSLQPDYLLTYRLAPIAVNRTLVVSEIHVHERSLAKGVDLDDVFQFWDRTNAEDRRICELQQRGLESSHASPGFYAESEDGLHAFEAMVARALLAGGPA
jgi:Rieske 2Fe-2S family protein